MPYKKQYAAPKRTHYEVWERNENGDRYDIKFICNTVNEYTAALIAQQLAERYKYVVGRSFVVRVKPTEAHNTQKFYTDDEYQHSVRMEDYHLERLTTELAGRVIAASVNGNGKPSPTVVKAIERVLH